MASDRPGPPAMPTLDSRRQRRPRLGLMAVAVGIGALAAACTGANGAGPTLTYVQPSPSASTLPGMDMSPSVSPPTTSTPPLAVGRAPAPTGTPTSSAPTGALLHISAQSIAFDTNHLEAPAGQAFVLDFDNNDPGIPHNVEIKDATGASMFKGQIITGPAKPRIGSQRSRRGHTRSSATCTQT